jgi:hypothetical protein
MEQLSLFHFLKFWFGVSQFRPWQKRHNGQTEPKFLTLSRTRGKAKFGLSRKKSFFIESGYFHEVAQEKHT